MPLEHLADIARVAIGGVCHRQMSSPFDIAACAIGGVCLSQLDEVDAVALAFPSAVWFVPMCVGEYLRWGCAAESLVDFGVASIIHGLPIPLLVEEVERHHFARSGHKGLFTAMI